RTDLVEPSAKLAHHSCSELRGGIGREHPRAIAEDIGLGRGSAARLLARHRMPTQKLRACDAMAGESDKPALGGARVGDKRAGRQKRVEMADGVEDAADGLREEDEVGLRRSFCE